MYNAFKKYRSTIVEIGVIFFFSLTPLLWLRGGEIVLGHDANYHLNHFSRMISSMFSWNDSAYYGSDWTYDRGYLPINIIQGLFLLITPSFSAMQIVFFVFLFFILGLSFYICIHEIFPEKNYLWFRLLTSIFAMYNFFILQGWFTADTGRILVFAGLPLYFLVIHKALTRVWSMKKSLFIFFLLSFFFNANGLPPLVGVQAVAIGIFGVLHTLFDIAKRGYKAIIYPIIVAFVMAVIFCAVNAYWLLPIFNFTSVSYSADLSKSGGIEGTLAWEATISKFASFSNLFRLQGIADWYDNINHAYSQPYISNPLLILLSFFPIGCILVGLITKNISNLTTFQKRFILCILALLPIGLFLSAGTHAPLGKLYELFMRYIPGFVIFRSSLYKFGFLLWIPMIISFGYFINILIQKISKKLPLQLIFVSVVIFWILGFHYPFFSPDQVFRFTPPFKTRFVLPSYVADMAHFIDATIPKNSRILLVPELDREYIGLPVDAYTWGFYSIMMLPIYISDSSYIADSESDRIMQMLYGSIYQNDNDTFVRLANKIGVTHVLFRRDVALSPGALKLHPIELVEADIKNFPSIRLVKNIGQWSLYQVFPNEVVPMVSTLRSYDLLTVQGLNTPYLIAQSISSPFHGVIRTFFEQTNTSILNKIQQEILEAECYMCKKDEYQSLVTDIVLPKTNALPGTWQYTRMQNKEKKIISFVSSNPKERIDADLSFSQRRLSEIITMIQKNYSVSKTSLTRLAYMDILSDLKTQYEILSGRDANIYAIRISAYLESQLKNLRKYNELTGEQTVVTSVIDEIKSSTWFTTEVASPRFGLTIHDEGYYSFYIPNSLANSDIIILDNRTISSRDNVFLSAGFHRFELTHEYPALFLERENGDAVVSIPTINYERINPTKYIAHVRDAKEPFILRFNQKYDSRWKAYINPANNYLDDIHHLEIDGYANGWLIQQTGDFDMVISYWPQRIFYLGMVISIASIGIIIISGLAIYLYANKKK